MPPEKFEKLDTQRLKLVGFEHKSLTLSLGTYLATYI